MTEQVIAARLPQDMAEKLIENGHADYASQKRGIGLETVVSLAVDASQVVSVVVTLAKTASAITELISMIRPKEEDAKEEIVISLRDTDGATVSSSDLDDEELMAAIRALMTQQAG